MIKPSIVVAGQQMAPDPPRRNHTRDTHALPPEHICDAYWKYNKIRDDELATDPAVVDFRRGLSSDQRKVMKHVKTVSSSDIAAACNAFRDHGGLNKNPKSEDWLSPSPCKVYEHDDFPGLRLYPFLLPPEAQVHLVSRIMHRDLSNPEHKTNINADYDVPYPKIDTSLGQHTGHGTSSHCDYSPSYESFFTRPQSSKTEMLLPKDPESKHKPLNMSQYLHKKLRWLTLGDQYDWPTRKYSGTDTTRFPPDIAELVRGLFPGLEAESGVVLLYSPKDYMPVHRDVSEQCERGLASFSLGCDGLFVIAKDTIEGEKGDGKTIVIRVKSGDVVQMDGETRWAWHAMPKVIAGTCPNYMKEWPAGSEKSMELGEDLKAYDKWRGFMAGKRLNISCRQVWN